MTARRPNRIKERAAKLAAAAIVVADTTGLFRGEHASTAKTVIGGAAILMAWALSEFGGRR